MGDLQILAVFSRVWGYDPSKPTADRTAKQEVRAFETHAARGLRHFALLKFIQYTTPLVFVAAFVLAIVFWSAMGVFGGLLGAVMAVALIFGYAKFLSRWFWI